MAARERRAIFSAGFTLLETLVALALIIGAMIGPFTLATSGIFNAKAVKNKLTALNLAQEGLEIIREMRDTNFLAGESNWRGLPNCDIAHPKCTVLASGIYNLDAIDDKPGAALEIGITPLQFDDAGGFYVKRGGTAETPFTRSVEIRDIGGNPDQMRVISKVEWNESGRTRSVKLEEVLYNWK